MPATYTIDSEREAVILRGEGTLTDDDLVSASRGLSSDPRFRSNFRIFTDHTAVVEFKLTPTSLKNIAEILKLDLAARRAILVSTTEGFGLARMYDAFCDLSGSKSPHAFYVRGEALAYLNSGVPPEKAIQ